ncbi:MAG: hypothetical protein ACI8S6_003186 [Myxococcota bacterium]|jgi:hypothetical protein
MDPLFGTDPEYIVEHQSRLSESLLWTLQRNYYDEHPNIFADGTVPMYATTNPFVARSCARLIEGFLDDCGGDEPATIVELGAGHGRFGFFCLSELLARRPDPVRYVLTDMPEHYIEAWAAHPLLAALAREHGLDWATFDAEEDTTLALRGSGQTISPEAPCGPLIIIANYVFDSLRHDAFRVCSNTLEEGRVSLVSAVPDVPLDTPGLLAELAPVFTYHPLESSAVYGEPGRDSVLAHYVAHLGDSVFSIPVGALRCIEALAAMSTRPVLVLSLDKAHNHPTQLRSQEGLAVVSHGCVSMMVNHDAIGRYAVEKGGAAMLSSPRSGQIESAAFVIGGPAGPRLTAAFADSVEFFSPADYLELFKGCQPVTLAGCLKLLRLSSWDPTWLCALTAIMAPLLHSATVDQNAELRDGLMAARRHIFPIGDEDQEAHLADFGTLL